MVGFAFCVCDSCLCSGCCFSIYACLVLLIVCGCFSSDSFGWLFGILDVIYYSLFYMNLFLMLLLCYCSFALSWFTYCLWFFGCSWVGDLVCEF